ncbi:MAG TPA: D-glycerate dehydrogenase [Casimicrobiaceae bacterium]|nr:D-glycerate dehydrogenase [Casimicrobiaceae bacterium]
MRLQRVFITQPIPARPLERLQALADVDWNRSDVRILTKPELVDAVRGHDILFCLLSDRIDAEVIAANPRLRMVASMKITPSDIDVAAASARRIPVTVVPPIVTEATADLHFAILLAVARRVVEADRLLRRGMFPGGQSMHLVGAGVWGKTIGLVGGGGRIGRAVARRAGGFGMRALYWGPRRIPEADERASGLEYVALDRLLSESDFVSLHAPLKPETVHLIGARELALMKPGAFLVNTARGPIVDEKALVDALAAKRIAGAALDVFEREPQVEQGLLAMSNVVLTPHLGSAVAETREALANAVVDNIAAVLAGKRPPNCWNAEIYEDPSSSAGTQQGRAP